VFCAAITKHRRLKVVHIGDSAGGGGAAHAMSRLHDALQRLGVDSNRLVRNLSRLGEAVETIATRGDRDDLFPAVREAVVRQYVELNRTSITNTHFSLYIDGVDVSRVPLVASSDIVHLHWTASFQTPSDVRALLDAKPVVWTLHDLGPLTGGCHFPAGCEGYADDCGGCPQLLVDPFRVTAATLRDKKTLWAGRRPTFIVPSRYMAEHARRSAVVQRAEASIVHIPHGVDVEAFRPLPKAAARAALGLPVGGLYVLCGSNYNSEQRKGLRFLNRVLGAAKARLQADPSELLILTVGEPKLDFRDLDGTRIFQLGRVSADVMPSVYAAADVFLHPSVEDNFPCMLLESLSCGTPAIAFDVGGIGDIIQDDVCGRLAAVGDELAMAAALSSLASDREKLRDMSERARAHIVKHFSDTLSARRHAELYDDVAKRPAVPRTAASESRRSGIEAIFPRWSTACLVQEAALAHERATQTVEESQAKSEHIAALERQAAGLALSLADQSRQVQEKEAELTAIHEVAAEREATIEEQRAEIELVHRVAADRGLLIEDLHRVAELRAKSEHDQREALAEQLHASAASIEALAANLHREVRERDDLLAKLEVTMDKQRAEIELVHRVAADRRLLIEDLHRVAEERAAVIDRLSALANAPQ
jgi:glycosyltransferase involved in cell wall biosynthesis